MLLPYGRFGPEVYPFRGKEQERLDKTIEIIKDHILNRHSHQQLHSPKTTHPLASPSLPAELILLVGRGDIPDNPSLSQSLVIPCDRFGGAFKHLDHNSFHPHLWLDFNLPESLHLLPHESFDRIIVDWSTFRYLEPMRLVKSSYLENESETTVLDLWNRILRKGGCLIFESFVASVQIIDFGHHPKPLDNDTLHQIEFQFQNPYHVSIPFHTAVHVLKSAHYDLTNSSPGKSKSPLHRLTHNLSHDSSSLHHKTNSNSSDYESILYKQLSTLQSRKIIKAHRNKNDTYGMDLFTVLTSSLIHDIEDLLQQSLNTKLWDLFTVYNENDGAGVCFPLDHLKYIGRWIQMRKIS